MTSPTPDPGNSRPHSVLTIEVDERDGGTSARLKGPLSVETPRSAWQVFPQSGGALTIDLAGLTALDLNGSAQLLEKTSRAEQGGTKVEFTGLPEEFGAIFNLAREALSQPVTAPPRRPGFLEEIGRNLVQIKDDLVIMTAFAGELLVELLRLIRRPSSLNWTNVLAVAETAGINSVPIVSLVSFLVGLIIAFQSAMVLKMFGAAIYVADMVGVAVVRELGPLIAAIVLAGRSGSAFSAELGAMKAAEEVDAITTMGLSPVRELALPRVAASIITTPIVTLIACFMGIFGGSLVLLAMGYSTLIYWEEAISMISPATFYISVGKSFLFGFVLAAIGCQRGLAAGDGPGAVGMATTSGVVTNIVAIAVLDSLLAVLFYVFDI